jgi:polyisoprenoid-binding protein YceI
LETKGFIETFGFYNHLSRYNFYWRLNMSKQRFLTLLSIVLLLVLAGCSAGSPAPTATPSPTPMPLPTVTPLPPTAEPEPGEEAESAVPTNTPEPSVNPIRTFNVVPESSKALYRVEEEFLQGAVERLGKQLGAHTAVGYTRTIEGFLELSRDDPPEVIGGQFIVNIRSLQSDDDLRDERIREQFLQSNQFPIAEFVVTRVEGFPTSYTEGQEVTFTLVGDLTIREITNEVTWEVTAALDGDTITETAYTAIMMVDFGFDPPQILGFIEALDPARIEMEIMAVEGEVGTAE